jgi:hypothetical protein
VQSSDIDKAAGLIRLTTTIARALGEGVSSEWPVAQIPETVAPHGAPWPTPPHALDLVGIAGEHDLDAPDLEQRAGPRGQTNSASEPARSGRPSLLGRRHPPGRARREAEAAPLALP